VAGTGLVVDDSGFEVLLAGARIGPRRLVSAADAAFLTRLAERYARAVRARLDETVLEGLGRELFRWLDGDEGQLTGLFAQAAAPVVFEVKGPSRPSAMAWAVLRAPFELLAPPGGGFLAADGLSRFCVVRRLGAAGEPPGLDGFRLGVAFMASAPRGQHELDFEAEEAAILRAAGTGRIDLVVEDSGDPAQLAHRLADLGGMPVVHLSCHGTSSWRPAPGAAGVPALMMEDDAGGERPTTAADLAGLVTVRPRLVFVSACLTAAVAAAGDGDLPPGNREKGGEPGGSGDGRELPAHSLATALVAAGMPAVLGWDGSVIDQAATAFAAKLYAVLADRADLAEAVGDARRALLGSDDPWVRADWHLARLWLGPGGGGPLVAGTRRRPLLTAHGTRSFLAGKPQVPVTSAEMFVGRRLELQRSLRALRSGDRTGVLLRGQGRLGKSSLAARIADRCPDHAVAVVYGDYTALGVLDAVAAAVRADPAARDLAKAGVARVREQPEAIEAVLTDLLSGPCAQRGQGNVRPLLLVIDDLEQVLVPDPEGPHQVDSGFAPVLAGVLRAFDPAITDSRLVITSRFAFTLSGLERQLEDVQLAPLSMVARAKLQRRQQDLAPPDQVAARSELARRAVAVSRGNPGLQDLAVARLVYGAQVPAARAEAAMTAMEAYLDRGNLPQDGEVRAFLENLALDALLAEAGPAGEALLRAATVFTLPVPETVIDTLAATVGGVPERLRGLGLLDPYPDLHSPARTALALSPLAVGRLEPLTDDEQAALATVIAGPLLAAWGGPAPSPARQTRLDLELARLALAAGDPDVTAVSAAGAVNALRDGPATTAAAFARQAITLLDSHHWPVPLDLLRQAAGAVITSGDGPQGEALLARAATRAEAAGENSDPLGRASVMFEQANHLITRGEPGQAEELLQRAWQLFTEAGAEREAAVVMGSIADIAYRRGDYDEALRIRGEIELPVYERLGDTRSAAVTWGRIADINYDRGDYDEALRIRGEIELPVYERLGDTRSAAVTWGSIADINYRRGDYDEAAELQGKRLEVNRKLGDLDGIAAAGWSLAQIDLARQDSQAAVPLLVESFQILSQLQRPDGIAVVGRALAQGHAAQGRQALHDAMTAAEKIGQADLARQISQLLQTQPPDEER
jgi:tetratricopeptide (TPR) repeat protein